MPLASSFAPLPFVVIQPLRIGFAAHFAATEDFENTDRVYCQRVPGEAAALAAHMRALVAQIWDTAGCADAQTAARPAHMDVLNGETGEDTGFSALEWAMCA